MAVKKALIDCLEDCYKSMHTAVFAYCKRSLAFCRICCSVLLLKRVQDIAITVADFRSPSSQDMPVQAVYTHPLTLPHSWCNHH